jgi:hypothetical protein
MQRYRGGEEARRAGMYGHVLIVMVGMCSVKVRM